MLFVRMLQTKLLISLSLILYLTRHTQGQPQDEDDNNYDDSKRMACMQAINAMAQEHPVINDAAEPFVLKGMHLMTLFQGPNRTRVTKTSYPDSTTQVYQRYREACLDGGGIFVPFTGALDCNNTVMDRTIPTTNIYANMATCFTSGPECEPYTSEPVAWMLDTQQVFQNVCALREGSLDNIAIAIPLSDHIPLPSGEPHFVPAAHYDDSTRKQCRDAMAEALNLWGDDDDDDPVSEAHFAHLRSMAIETIQEEPVLMQKQWYEDGVTELYQQRCQEAKWRYEAFNGTLDCIDPAGRKTTTVYKNTAACFPPGPACEGYASWGQWTIDTMMGLGKVSCTIRAPSATEAAVDSTSSPEDSSSSPGMHSKPTATQNNDSSATSRGAGSSLVPFLGALVGACMIVAAAIAFMQHRWKRQPNETQSAKEDDPSTTVDAESSDVGGLPDFA